MIVWTPNFPKHKRPLGYLRLLLARYRFFNHFTVLRKGRFGLGLAVNSGYHIKLRDMYNKYKDRRCFIIGNGPSLQKMDMSLLKDEITIGSNGIYKTFPEWGFSTDFIMFEDTEQTELRGHDIYNIQNSIILASLYNAYAFKANENTIFMNVRRADGTYWNNLAPMFSKDFAYIVYLGSTITYLAMQLAYHLGCNPVYLIGVDHNYGQLPKIFPPGKVTITEENIGLVRGIHFDKNYYKIGDQIGVPHVQYQEDAYSKAREVFEESGRQIFNVGEDSKLDIFERKSFDSLF